jgi:proline racemase
MKAYQPSDHHWQKITTTMDALTEGEPFLVIAGGLSQLQGDTILALRRCMRNNYDHLRHARREIEVDQPTETESILLSTRFKRAGL